MEGNQCEPIRTIVLTEAAIIEYSNSNNLQRSIKVLNPKDVGKERKIAWQAPPEGWFKINCDGAYKEDDREAGIGVVVRDNEGKVIDGKGMRIFTESAAMAEAEAIRQGLCLAIERGYQKLIVETDSKEVMDDLEKQNKGMTQWKLPPILSDIWRYRQKIQHAKMSLTPGTANQAADWIAVQSRNKGRGLLTHGWAPQLSILSHPAIGGFLTHCGWNSVLEGLCAGLPLITWPFLADQFFNEKLVVQVLGIGERVGAEIAITWGEEEKYGATVKREQIRKAIDLVMDSGEEGEERRKKAAELQVLPKKAFENKGSS